MESDRWHVTGDKTTAAAREVNSCHASRATCHPSGFTLLELLVVISILGILAAMTVPVLKNFGRSDATLGASRQLLDGVARARQLAMSDRTTVYMVFIPTNFWVGYNIASATPSFPNTWWNKLTPALQTAVTNLADRQLSGYNFIARGAMGDQPGQHTWHYLDRWQGLPEGTFIAFKKFAYSASTSYPILTDPLNNNSFAYKIYGFNTRDDFPFPTEQGTNTYTDRIILPYVAFNYLGQLTVDGQTVADQDEYIPLAHGSVLTLANATTKALMLATVPPPPTSPEVSELPPGNSTNLSYNVVHIDRLTGRAVLEFHKLQ